ncbi:unknown [Clostridium sp. CAG:524]|nr:unknown [Clostridium sp. CAG:524]
MKVELCLIKERIIKDKIWIILLFAILIIEYFSYYIEFNDFSINNQYYISLIGYPFAEISTNISVLYNMYCIVYLVYFSITYFNHELEDLKEYIIVREKSKKWIVRKIFFIFLYIILIKLLLIFMLNLFCSFRYNIGVSYYLLTFLYIISISILSITINNIVKSNTIATIVSVLLSYLLYFEFDNFLVISISIVVLIILNIIFFRFKRMYKLKDY